MTTLKNNLPEIVREYLTKTGISQANLAKATGLDQSTLSRMLRMEQRRLDLDTVEALQKVIGFEPSDLIITIED